MVCRLGWHTLMREPAELTSHVLRAEERLIRNPCVCKGPQGCAGQAALCRRCPILQQEGVLQKVFAGALRIRSTSDVDQPTVCCQHYMSASPRCRRQRYGGLAHAAMPTRLVSCQVSGRRVVILQARWRAPGVKKCLRSTAHPLPMAVLLWKPATTAMLSTMRVQLTAGM